MKIVVLNKKKQNQVINNTINILKKGGLVIFPSDTIYGALVDATNEEAVKKLISFKVRPPGKPISVFVTDFKMLQSYVEVDEKQITLLKQLLPGPFTVVLPSKHKVSFFLESEKGTLGVRYPFYPFITEIVKKLGRPVTATSANLSGRPPHYQIKTLLKELPKSKRNLIDFIVDIGKLPRNKPSTVIDLITSQIKVIRQGDIVFSNEKNYLSFSPYQTKKIAKFILEKAIQKNKKPLVFIIEGELGVGKTVFVKGIGEWLGINNIISPSFVIYYEYQPVVQSVKRLIHMDLYNIEESLEFRYLGIERYLKEGNILCIEWGEKIGEILPIIKKYGKIIYIKMKYLEERKRKISLHYINKL